MRLKRKGAERRLGIALFILMTSIAIISLMLRELFTVTSQESTRVRNYGDRIQALYLARSALNLSRFILAVDRLMANPTGQAKATDAVDKLDDLWATPVMFPLHEAELEAITSIGNKDKPPTDEQTKEQKEFMKKCEDFFEDFPGDAVSVTADLSGRLGLNDVTDAATPDMYKVLQELLRPNVEFLRHLNERNVRSDELAREIKDYADQDTEDDVKTPESGVYTSMQLDYEPKNRAFTNMDELKMIPHMDDFIFDFLSEHVSPYYIPQRVSKKININTTNKIVFQSLLMGLSDADSVAAKFIEDRKEKKRIYTEKEAGQQLSDALQLKPENVRLNLITGASDSFKIETTATVNQVQLKLETIVSRNLGGKKVEPIVQMRISP